MRWKNTLRIAEISTLIYPKMQGSVNNWFYLIWHNWNNTQLLLWQKYCLKRPTPKEAFFAAMLASMSTQANQIKDEYRRSRFVKQKMIEFSHRAALKAAMT